MTEYCEVCGEKVDYPLRKIPVVLDVGPDKGRVVMLRACELCDDECNADRENLDDATG